MTRLRPWAASATAAVLGLSLIVVATGASPASAASCRPTPTLLSRTPVQQFALPGGASVRIWDTGNLANNLAEVRLAVVRIPAGTLTPAVIASPTLSRAATPLAMAQRDPLDVVVINGQHFNPALPGIPEKSEMVNGILRKAKSATELTLAIYGPQKTAAWATGHMVGSVSSVRGRVTVGALNWQTLASSGASIYTYAWGTRAHSYGPRTVVVTNGVVTGFRSGSAGAGRPAANQKYLTAPTGAALSALLQLRVGDAVTVTTTQTGLQLSDGAMPHHTIGRPTGVIGFGGTIVRDGVLKADCTARSEELRPRSALVMLRNGDMLVVSASGRATVSGTRFGGATVHQFADLLRRLGAVNAFNLDGGTSTTLLVRKTVGGPLIRLDRSMSEFMRPVADALTFRAL